jgi:catechol 2,3-dioxygenase-like lactoylglutathione lyase family enzyme
VRDLDAMIAFYSDVLGCALERGPGEMRLAQLRAGASLIDLVDIAGSLGGSGQVPALDAPNMDHVCLFIEPWDAAAVTAHLKRHGIEAGEVADRYGANGQGPSIYIADPEGNTVELKGAA